MNRTAKTILLMIALMLAFAFVPHHALALTDQDIAALGDAPAAPASVSVVTPAAPSLGKILSQLFIALAVVFGLMWGAVWLARKYMPQVKQGGRNAPIQVIATRSIGTRRSLMLVRVQGRTLLLGTTPQSIQTLSEFEGDAGTWRDAAWESGLDNAAGPSPRNTPESPR